ncbi:MAG: hypothetical protein DHS20C20_34360 [Ardenticatenaceae bacterium]|nr:MAG: hypothetical protein DHS20C20_34360 [Ardenticatenaceae bacterium]
MAMYRVQPEKNKMQLFLSTKFGEHYHEHDLENWLEQNPAILTDGQPLLIISRQPATPFSGVPDLIGVDEDGNTVVIELKRGRPPRDVLAQALEYAAWLANLSGDEIERLANQYLQPRTLAEAWHETFAGDVVAGEGETAVTLPQNLQLNSRQRIFVVIEGNDDRITAVARYLRTLGVDINLIEYRYYRIQSGEEMLDIELTVGPEQDSPATRQVTGSTKFTEEKVYSQWSVPVQRLYFRFREQLLAADDQLQISPQKSAVSFYKQTRDARVYICSINAHGTQVHVSFRTDSLEPHMDVETAVANITQQAPEWMLTNRGIIWFTMRFMGSETAVDFVAELIVGNLVKAL